MRPIRVAEKFDETGKIIGNQASCNNSVREFADGKYRDPEVRVFCISLEDNRDSDPGPK
jgi:hypothetical protein